MRALNYKVSSKFKRFYFHKNHKIMHINKKFHIIFLLMIMVTQTFSQEKEEVLPTVNIISIGFSGGIDLPGADLATQFGFNNTVGGSFMYKTSKNWLFSLDCDFIFGQKVKITNQLFKEIATSNGNIINGSGVFTTFSLLERGMTTNLSVGKIFPVFNSNKNSGIVVSLGAGFMYHKIRLEQDDTDAPQISGDYAKGYDRLAGGLVITEFVGYQYYENNNIANFYAGFEFHQGLTKAMRPWNFDEMQPPKSNRFDILNGLKFGWIIPLGKQTGRKSFSF